LVYRLTEILTLSYGDLVNTLE